MNASEEVDGASVVAGRDVAEVLELVDEALDPIAQPIGQRVMRNDNFAGWLGRDHDLGTRVMDELPDQVAVVSFVADDSPTIEFDNSCGAMVMS